jgi:hypothetical protein
MTQQRSGNRRRRSATAPFPVIDNEGNTITGERRRVLDRRLENIAFELRLCLYSEMPRPCACERR